ncbi:IS66 family transposase zinc-finger binding domain-containing protein [Streptomyces hawaiiensis]|uniref:IS66 family transposase zinc-finger binding domain-containing protein n=1 Tax=Streptomyces hawaiiensis TaxID=67305 RepID=UPI00364F7064
MAEHPDVTEGHVPAACTDCGSALGEGDSIGFERRQVRDIPLTTVKVTEHRAHHCRCACGTVTAEPMPGQIPGSPSARRVRGAGRRVPIRAPTGARWTVRRVCSPSTGPATWPISMSRWSRSGAPRWPPRWQVGASRTQGHTRRCEAALARIDATPSPSIRKLLKQPQR